nr:hypothetical protein [Tanacetum cinerariifolium]
MARTPQQNDVAERKNRTLINAAKRFINVTLAKTLIAIKAAKPKVISTAATTVTTAITTPRVKEHEKPLKKKDQIALDEEVARKLKDEMKLKWKRKKG